MSVSAKNNNIINGYENYEFNDENIEQKIKENQQRDFKFNLNINDVNIYWKKNPEIKDVFLEF